MRGMVLDSPSKGKMTETSVVEGVMSIVQPALRTGQASGHLSISLCEALHWYHAS